MDPLIGLFAAIGEHIEALRLSGVSTIVLKLSNRQSIPELRF